MPDKNNEDLIADVFFWKALAYVAWFWLVFILVCILVSGGNG